jgi:hypothetical protein
MVWREWQREGGWCGLTGKGEQLLKCVDADISLVLGEIERGISANVLAGGPIIRHGEADVTTVPSDVVPSVTCRGESTAKVFSGGAKVPDYGLQCTYGPENDLFIGRRFTEEFRMR